MIPCPSCDVSLQTILLSTENRLYVNNDHTPKFFLPPNLLRKCVLRHGSVNLVHALILSSSGLHKQNHLAKLILPDHPSRLNHSTRPHIQFHLRVLLQALPLICCQINVQCTRMARVNYMSLEQTFYLRALICHHYLVNLNRQG